MQWKGTPKPDYYLNYERVELPRELTYGWFEVYKLKSGIYVVAEPDNYQEVRFFVVPGTEQSLIYDTGMGIYPSRPLAEHLIKMSGCDPEKLFVVNSHCHFDHIGCNSTFDVTYGSETPTSREVAENGVGFDRLWSQVEDSVFRYGAPEGLDLSDYHIDPYNFKALEDSQLIDLGNRKFTVIFTPGHSGDGLMLYDKENGVLFCGDSFYKGPLYAYFASAEYGKANLNEYHDSLAKVCEIISDDTTVIPSHNDFYAAKSDLEEARDLFAGIIDGSLQGELLEGEEDLYENEVLRLRELHGKEFSIMYPA